MIGWALLTRKFSAVLSITPCTGYNAKVPPEGGRDLSFAAGTDPGEGTEGEGEGGKGFEGPSGFDCEN